MRRVLVERFPYSLFYSFDDDEIIILGCVHWRQNPESWRYRR